MASARGTGSAGGGTRTAIEAPTLTRCAGSRIVRPSMAISPARISALRRERESPACWARTRSTRRPSSLAATRMVCVPVSFAMADPSSDKPDQPAAAEGRTPEDAATRLNEILSSPIEDPFAPEGKAPRPPEAKPVGSPPDPAGREAAKAVPPDFAAWEGAKASASEAAPDKVSAPREAPASVEAVAPPAAEPVSAAEPAPAPQATPSDPGAARVIAKVRRLMLVSTVLTALAVAAVLGIIGYRLFRSEGSQAPTQATLTLPPGAKIVQSAIADDRIVLTLQVGGALEIRTYDLKTLKPLGRLNFSTVP